MLTFIPLHFTDQDEEQHWVADVSCSKENLLSVRYVD